MNERLYRSTDDRMLAGVAGGVAEHLDADPSIIRIIWAVLIFLTGGLALVVYVVMAVVVPDRPDGMPLPSAGGPPDPSGATGAEGTAGPVPDGGWQAPDGSTVPLAASTSGRRHRRDRRDRDDRARGGLVAGLVLIVLGGFFLVRQFIPAFDLSFWWPTAAIGLGVLLIILALMPSRRSG